MNSFLSYNLHKSRLLLLTEEESLDHRIYNQTSYDLILNVFIELIYSV